MSHGSPLNPSCNSLNDSLISRLALLRSVASRNVFFVTTTPSLRPQPSPRATHTTKALPAISPPPAKTFWKRECDGSRRALGKAKLRRGAALLSPASHASIETGGTPGIYAWTSLARPF